MGEVVGRVTSRVVRATLTLRIEGSAEDVAMVMERVAPAITEVAKEAAARASNDEEPPSENNPEQAV